MKSSSEAIQVKATEQVFPYPVVLSIRLQIM